MIRRQEFCFCWLLVLVKWKDDDRVVREGPNLLNVPAPKLGNVRDVVKVKEKAA